MTTLNELAASLVEKLIERADELHVAVQKSSTGASIIDCGVKAEGSYEVGRLLTEICLANSGRAELTTMNFDGGSLPAVSVSTDTPALACLGSQMAGWKIKEGEYFAIGSGPARILAKKPAEIYELLNYSEQSDVAVLVLEASEFPPDTAIKKIARECKLKPKQLYILVASTVSIAGSTQVSGRAAESGLHKLLKLGFDVKRIKHASGMAPIAPVVQDPLKMMGNVNDAIFAAGQAWYTADVEGIDVNTLIDKVPSSASSNYGTPFHEVLKKADFDFYKIDPNLFSVAEATITDIKTGKEYHAGKVDLKLLKTSLGI